MFSKYKAGSIFMSSLEMGDSNELSDYSLSENAPSP